MKKATCIILILAVFSALCLWHFDEIHGQDEISHYMNLPRMLFLHGYSRPESLHVFSPHLYPFCTWGVCELFGDANSFCMRLPGVLFWLMTCGMVLGITRKKLPISALIFLVSVPAVIVGAGIVEIDQTILPLGVLFAVFCFYRWLQNENLLNALAFGVSYVLLLWCRLSAPIVLAPLLLFFSFRLGANRWKTAGKTALILAVACGVFAASWWFYGAFTGVYSDGIYEYLVSPFGQTTVGERSSSLRKLILTAVYDSLWGFNPFLLLLVGLAWRRQFKRMPNRPDDFAQIYLWAGTWLLLCFGVVGGSLFGFPKYQLCSLPLLVIALALTGNDAWHWNTRPSGGWLECAILLVGMAVGIFIVGDALYDVRVTARLAVASATGSPLAVMAQTLGRVAAGYALMGGVLGMIARWRPCVPRTWLIALAAIAFNLGTVAVQHTTNYQHGYIYGDSGDIRAVSRMIREQQLSLADVLVPMEVLDAYDWRAALEQPAFLPGNISDVQAAVVEKSPRLVALSHLIYESALMKDALENDEFKAFMKARGYSQTQLGSFVVWQR